MEREDYQKLYTDLCNELSTLKARRTQIETDLGDLNMQIERLDKATDHLAALAGYARMFANDLSELGITDAVHEVLDPEQRLSVAEIKAKMEAGGFDFSKYSAPNSSISTILRRLVDAGKAEPEKEGWKTFYKAIKAKEEDIPF
jgi:hypothetical protein